MATFEQTVERYNAGQTDLKAETAFIFNSQGEAAAYEFARALDEAIGAKPYSEVMAYTAYLKEQASKPTFNEAAAAQSEMYKQKLVREKIEKQAKEKALADSVALNKSTDLGDVMSKNKQPILIDSRPGGKGGPGGGPDIMNKEVGGYKPLSESKGNMTVYILLVIAAVGLLYVLTSKK
jgi:hypothetical protein